MNVRASFARLARSAARTSRVGTAGTASDDAMNAPIDARRARGWHGRT